MRKVAICVLFIVLGLVSMSQARMAAPEIKPRKPVRYERNEIVREEPVKQEGLLGKAWNTFISTVGSVFSSSKNNEKPVNRIEFSQNRAPFTADLLEEHDRNLNADESTVKMIRLENMQRIY